MAQQTITQVAAAIQRRNRSRLATACQFAAMLVIIPKEPTSASSSLGKANHRPTRIPHAATIAAMASNRPSRRF